MGSKQIDHREEKKIKIEVQKDAPEFFLGMAYSAIKETMQSKSPRILSGILHSGVEEPDNSKFHRLQAAPSNSTSAYSPPPN